MILSAVVMVSLEARDTVALFEGLTVSVAKNELFVPPIVSLVVPFSLTVNAPAVKVPLLVQSPPSTTFAPGENALPKKTKMLLPAGVVSTLAGTV